MTSTQLMLFTWVLGLSGCLAVLGVTWWYSRAHEDEGEGTARRAAARDWLDRQPFAVGDRVQWGTVRATVEEVSIDGSTVLLATDTGNYEWTRTKDLTRIMRRVAA